MESPGAFVGTLLGRAIGWYRPAQDAGLIGAVWARSSSWRYRASSSAGGEPFETQRAPASFSVSGRGWAGHRGESSCSLPAADAFGKMNQEVTNLVPRFDVSSVPGSRRRPRRPNRWFQRASLSLSSKARRARRRRSRFNRLSLVVRPPHDVDSLLGKRRSMWVIRGTLRQESQARLRG